MYHFTLLKISINAYKVYKIIPTTNCTSYDNDIQAFVRDLKKIHNKVLCSNVIQYYGFFINDRINNQ